MYYNFHTSSCGPWRNISLISTNLIVYYSTLKLNTLKFKNFIASYDTKVLKKYHY